VHTMHAYVEYVHTMCSVRVCMRVCVRAYVRACVYERDCLPTNVAFRCIHVCVCVCVRACMYIYAYKSTRVCPSKFICAAESDYAVEDER